MDGEKSDARFGGHRRCIATPLPGGNGLSVSLPSCDVAVFKVWGMNRIDNIL